MTEIWSFRGGVIIKKRENLGTMSQIDISDLFEKCGSISDILEFENIVMAKDPRD